MRFTWDVHKRTKNLRKHKVDFADATLVFTSDYLSWEDTRKAYPEQRFLALGPAHREILLVAYELPDDETVRIISARRAEPHERRRYIRDMSL